MYASALIGTFGRAVSLDGYFRGLGIFWRGVFAAASWHAVETLVLI